MMVSSKNLFTKENNSKLLLLGFAVWIHAASSLLAATTLPSAVREFGGVTLSDVGSSLRHVVGLATLTGEALQAADVDNDGTVSLSDVGSSLRHVVGLSTINTYDLVDGNGELVTNLGPSNDVTILYLVENGDVSLDGGFVAIA